MFTKEEIEQKLRQLISAYSNNIEDIQFDVDLKLLGEFDESTFARYSTFILEITGLLTLLITVNGGLIEYHKKVQTLDELKYAITHLSEWEDDWNN